jgi:hypothetical protein
MSRALQAFHFTLRTGIRRASERPGRPGCATAQVCTAAGGGACFGPRPRCGQQDCRQRAFARKPEPSGRT